MDDRKWIRPFTPADPLYFPDDDTPHAIAEGALLAFTIGKGSEHWGWTAVYPVPGLDSIYEIDGFVLPRQRRRGAATDLLHHLIKEMGKGQLSYAVTKANDPAIHFFRANNFYIEHEEWELVHDGGQHPIPAANGDIQPAATQPLAVQQFLRLYEEIFAPHRWYQPFTPAEMEFMLVDGDDMLFLMDGTRPIGFAWLHLSSERGEVEPIGVLPAYQGQGNGRFLLQTALNRLYDKGAKMVKIGVWRENETAVSLYQSVGFRQHKTLTYYALDL